jgi:hypothetical protein
MQKVIDPLAARHQIVAAKEHHPSSFYLDLVKNVSQLVGPYSNKHAPSLQITGVLYDGWAEWDLKKKKKKFG